MEDNKFDGATDQAEPDQAEPDDTHDSSSCSSLTSQ